MILDKMKENTKGTDYEFPYGITQLRKLVRLIGFRFCRTETRSVIMESTQIAAWRLNFYEKFENCVPKDTFQCTSMKLGMTLMTPLRNVGLTVPTNAMCQAMFRKGRELLSAMQGHEMALFKMPY